MKEKFDALQANNTWDVVSCPPEIKPIECKWVYKVKLNPDDSLDCYKARLVALGNHQEYGVDYDETFAPVAKMATVWTILTIAASKLWPLYHMDVKNAFLHSDLKEKVYMRLPPLCETSSPTAVAQLRRSLYGVKKAPIAWFENFQCPSTTCFFTVSLLSFIVCSSHC